MVSQGGRPPGVTVERRTQDTKVPGSNLPCARNTQLLSMTCARILTKSVTSSTGARIYGKHRALLVIRQMGSLRDIPGDCKKSTKYLRRESVVRLYAGRDYEYASIEIGVCNSRAL